MRSVALVGTDRVPDKRALGQRGLLLVVDHGGLVERLLPAEHGARASDMKRSMPTISPTPSTRSGR
jgi:hypothetical protein